VTVTPAGRINMPVAGQMAVTGKTTTQLATEIAKRLNARVVDPEVTVSLKQSRTRRVFVLGAVAKPGVHDMKPGWRIAQALTAAGGLAGRADETTLTLSRPGQKPVAVDVPSILENPAARDNLALNADDVLVVNALEPRRITVSGDVVKPDIYELRRSRRLVDALVAAGGLKQTPRDSKGFLVRAGQRIDLDLTAALSQSDESANMALQPNDLIMIEALPAFNISVDGLVKQPGNFQMQRDATVLQAVAQAGGLSVPAENVVANVRRGSVNLPVDLVKAAFEPTADLLLQNGDLLLLSEPQVIRVQVTGQVRQPGALRLPPGTSVLDAIARAGGLAITPEAARVRILRMVEGRQQPLEVDAASLVSLRDLSQNVRLQDGDLVSVTQIQARVVFVSGQVARPGAYDLKEGDGLKELIARAGGPTDAASLRRITLSRDNTARTFDLLAALRQGAAPPEAELQEGDFVVVPENMARVLVTQEVNRPGYYAIPEDRPLTIGEALSMAGGPKDRAKLNEVAIFRRTPEGLKRRVVQLDKPDPKIGGDLGINQTLQTDDVLYVPFGKPSRSLYDRAGQAIGALTSLRFLGIF
jgi:polysaccharide export outer membrane protein